MHLSTMRLSFVTVILIFMSVNCLAQPEIFRWVDDKGVVHFSQQPPADGESEKVDPHFAVSRGVEASPDNAAAAEAVSPAEKIRQERAIAQREAAEKKAATEEGCKNAKAIIAQLEPMPRVMTRNEEGEMVRMDDNVRLEKLSQAQDYVAANCLK